MGRILSILLAALLAFVLAGTLIWYLAYGIRPSPPGRVTLDSLESPVQIDWHEEGFATIREGRELDQYAALGFVHGRTRTWSVTLWRQTALGHLGSWFGNSVLEVDSLTHRLGLAHLARQAYDRLPPAEKERLQAYSDGMNAALQGNRARSESNLTLLDLQPAAWKPWHSLAIERLFAWLAASPPPADSLKQAGPEVAAFFEADRRLRQWLHLHGFEHSAAWVASDSSGTHLYRRYVYGASALPFLQEVALQRSDSTYMLGASLPGTPFFPTGQTPDHAWAVLPRSSLELTQGALPDTLGQPIYERLEGSNRQEYLLRTWRPNGTLPFREDAPPSPARPQADTTGYALRPDTLSSRRTWMLQWDGFRPTSDAAAWHALSSGEMGSFQLIDGDGLYLQPDGSWRVSGSPRVQQPLANGVMIGQTRWAEYLATYLDTLSSRPAPDVATWSDDCHSTWAAEHAPSLIASIDSVDQRVSSNQMQEAITYLRNWNYAYDQSSIAASVFDTWATLYQEQTGRLPGEPLPEANRPVADPALSPPDTTADTTRTAARPDTLSPTYQQHRERFRLLAQAVRQLTEEYGNDLRQWRWERVNQSRYYFPVWSEDTLETASAFITETRYAPLKLPGRGHPSAPCWGTSLVANDLPTPAMWQGWTSTGSWQQLTIQYRRFEFGRFMDRYRIPDRLPAPQPLAPFPSSDRSTILAPPS